MKKRIVSLGILLVLSSVIIAQNNLNTYKYILVPDKFDTFKENDKYQLNSLTKFLFEKYGFQTFGEKDTSPADVANNPCLVLTAKLNNESNMFTTKVNIDLIDCYNKVVFSSKIGKSKIKEFTPSFHEALRNSFISFQKMDYKFDPSLAAQTNVIVANPVKTVTPKAAPTIENKKAPIKESIPMVAVTPATPIAKNNVQVANSKEVSSSIAKSYKNQNISFMLIDQNNKMVAYVKNSTNKNYKNGEMIGTFTKTSLPNVYRVTWKNMNGTFESTTGYIDEAGNLKIDINQNGSIKVVTFEVEN